METMPEKQRAHQLIEQLPDSQVETAVRFLESMLLDPAGSREDFYLELGLDQLAKAQDVEPMRNSSVLIGAIPADQDVDEFLEAIYAARK